MRPAQISAWVFDLDNTLYPASALYDEIGVRMTRYIADKLALDETAAGEVRERYFHQYGATLTGLMRHHNIDAMDFLRHVHDADHSVLSADAELRDLILALPGRRIIFTNGGGGHPERVLETLGLADAFDAIFDIEAADFAPKPEPASYQRLVTACGIDPQSSMLIEDTLRNLEPAHEMGFATALVGYVHPDPHPPYVDYTAPDLKTLLQDWTRH